MTTSVKFIGTSPAALLMREEVDYASRSDAKVLITGESGVGKEVVARMIHEQSRRRAAPLITLNCAGVPDSLLASEMFGHVRGSFTDAHRDKAGWLERGHRGTIFIDEIGEMSLQMQSLLLRFFESGEIQPVGSDKPMTHVDVRVVTATNRVLTDRVAKGEFREDLFYRLNVIHIQIPPLRERRDDIPLLLDHFLHFFSNAHNLECPRLSHAARAQLIATDWPGNVRQLRNIAERLVVRAREGIIDVTDLPREVLSPSSRANDPQLPATVPAEQLFQRMVRDGETFWDVVYKPFMARDLTRADLRAVVRHALALTGGHYKDVAQLFNVPGDYKRLLSFLRKYQCHLPIQEFRAIRAQPREQERPFAEAVGE